MGYTFYEREQEHTFADNASIKPYIQLYAFAPQRLKRFLVFNTATNHCLTVMLSGLPGRIDRAGFCVAHVATDLLLSFLYIATSLTSQQQQ